MKFQLSVVALALLQVGTANGASFTLNAVDRANIDTSKWHCKRCDSMRVDGEIGLSLLGSDADNAHAANRMGDDSEAALALQANVQYQQAGTRLQLQAQDLGMETGSGKVAYQFDRYAVALGYQSQLTVDAAQAQGQYGVNGEQLVASTEVRTALLQKKRESWQLSGKVAGESWSSFARYGYQRHSGQQLSSVQVNKSPVNFVKPIDSSTQTLHAGTELFGPRWLAMLSYQGSVFDNSNTGLRQGQVTSLQAFAPNNEAHQAMLQGQYRFDRTSLSGRVVKGWRYQNQDYVDGAGVAAGISHLNGEVTTLAANFKLASALSRNLKVNAKFDYRDRDNRTPIQLFNAVEYDPLSGQASHNVALDSEKAAYQLEANYRFAQGGRLTAGVQHIYQQRSDSAREESQEQRLFAKLKYHGFEHWNFSVQGEYGQRDGSAYQAAAATSSEDNELLRKYHLADRDRTAVEFNLSQIPHPNVVIDFSVRYALDDYSANRSSALGLSESTDSGYDLAINYQPLPQLDLYLLGGQQRIESNQLGSQSFAQVDWRSDNEDRFMHIGIGSRYSGLLQQALVLGLDYSYSQSESDAAVTNQSAFADYSAWSHNANLYAEYAINAAAKLKLNYRYERYYDTDYADVSACTTEGLTPLGNLSSNYNAHQLMLTLSYVL
ncbi:MtrB/PioB family decaheme-associated outer membrane protein [uncultured Ferrimonas sp.]|uniref:MtrB/PioB family decaheme-associated outer membrane protein n=1 Tax=uncultured Ferrimonas sp. TaxID=432640 RepID=UPI002624245E|nr:MtrB/PioB family decaheme-associated outer membrane protein [uncultured Ferrimonas sp.]